MSRMGIQPTVITYNSAITAVARGGGGQWRQAVALVKEMAAAGLVPDAITYNSLIVACGRAGQWKQALSVLRGMKKQGIRCDIIAYSAAISACGDAGKWQYSVGERKMVVGGVLGGGAVLWAGNYHRAGKATARFIDRGGRFIAARGGWLFPLFFFYSFFFFIYFCVFLSHLFCLVSTCAVSCLVYQFFTPSFVLAVVRLSVVSLFGM